MGIKCGIGTRMIQIYDISTCFDIRGCPIYIIITGMDVASHAQEAVTPEIFQQIIHSVNIVDYSLFGG